MNVEPRFNRFQIELQLRPKRDTTNPPKPRVEFIQSETYDEQMTGTGDGSTGEREDVDRMDEDLMDIEVEVEVEVEDGDSDSIVESGDYEDKDEDEDTEREISDEEGEDIEGQALVTNDGSRILSLEP